ncbi:MAG TPA: hypothetical protein VLH60_05010, partial [Sedimentisphaerales bacterium]|nr:hypothetical protein [Sedimentisphaerales bacterium]
SRKARKERKKKEYLVQGKKKESLARDLKVLAWVTHPCSGIARHARGTYRFKQSRATRSV